MSKITKQSVSGTGNGVGEKNLVPFIAALKDFEKLIRTIYKHYEKNPKDSFSSKFQLINNWHDTYKIELRNEEFPFHLCNGIDVFHNGWNDVILSAKFPLKFKAPTFHGYETEDMSFALTTQVSLYENSFNNFMNRKDIPEHIKTEILKGVLQYAKEHVVSRYEKDMKNLLELAEKRKIEIKESEETIKLNSIEIPEIEARIKEIETILAK